MIEGDCVEAMRAMPEASVDAIARARIAHAEGQTEQLLLEGAA